MSDNPFHHEQILRGSEVMESLKNVSVVVCGCGAIGSNLVDTMVRQGFTNIKVADFDRVEPHNINTQMWTLEDCGALKVSAMENHAYRTLEVELETFNKRVTAKNIKKFIGNADIVIDAFDNTESRRLVTDYCLDNNIACFHLGMTGRYAEAVWNEAYTVPEDGGEDVCDYPLARNLVSVIVAVGVEEIIDFISGSRRTKSWCFTLGDFKISEYR